MAGKTPKETHRQWEKLFNAGDVEGVLELYEKDAALFPQPGQQVNGIDAVRETIKMFVQMEAKFDVQDATIAEAGDVALVMAPWTATAKGPDGAMDMAGTTSDVLVKGSDGAWRFKIDNPYGTGA
jgi:uncharacterized protein (TIGR02246 family)